MGFWSEVASAAIGGLASMFGANSSRKSQAAANAANLEQTRLTNEANLRIADATNKMNYKIMQENNEFNERMALKMFDLENTYNSPVEQMKRYAQAGLNPAVMMSGGGTGSAQSAPADAATPVGQPATMIPGAPMEAAQINPTQTPSNSLIAFSSVADAFNSLSSSVRNSVEAKNARKKLNYELDNLLSQAKNADAQASYTKFQENLDRVFSPFERQGKLDFLKNQISESAAKAVIAANEAESSAVDYQIKNIELLFKQAEASMKQQEKDNLIAMSPLLIQQLKESIKLIQSQQDTEKSKQNANNASAQVSYQQAKSIKDTLDFIKDNYKEDIKNKKFERVKYALEKKFQALGIGTNPLNRIFSRVISDDSDFNVSAGEILDWINDNSDR